MKKSHWFAAAATLLLLASILFAQAASAHPQDKTYTVNSNTSAVDANPGDGVCATAGGKCTLYAAIQEANADGQPSTINFASLFQGTNYIQGCSSLPDISEDWTFIDGSSQWDTVYNRPGIEIRDSGACTLLNVTASHTIVVGIFFSGGASGGVALYGNYNTIGGYKDGQRNVFLTSNLGVYTPSGSAGSSNNVIANNYFGTINGTSLAGGSLGQTAINLASGKYNTISDNLIAGQGSYGIYISFMSSDNSARGNTIGMSSNFATALPNAVGVYVAGLNNTIGPDNVIAGNTGNGIELINADYNKITGNQIGYNTGTVGNGGDGINLRFSDNNQIDQSNVIAYNTGDGIDIYSSSTITITGNYIQNNTGRGIYLRDSSGAKIGGGGPQQPNHIGSNHSHAIHLDASSNIIVTGNFIGLKDGAFDAGNTGYGVLIDNGSANNHIGDIGPGLSNWISWNDLGGIMLDGSATQHNYIVSNIIGAPNNWNWEAGNGNHGIGIYNGAHDNYIGWGGKPYGSNIILSSGWSGIAIVASNDNVVQYNYIGTNGHGLNWGNAFYGITTSGLRNSIKENEIAYNGTHGGIDGGEAGVWVDGATTVDNMVTGNSIHDNDGPGITLTNSANHNLAAPTITNASCKEVQGTACANCLVEIYSGHDEEGKFYEGFYNTPSSGAISWTGSLHGPNVTALVIGPGAAKDTSMFSTPFPVGACLTSRVYVPMVVR